MIKMVKHGKTGDKQFVPMPHYQQNWRQIKTCLQNIQGETDPRALCVQLDELYRVAHGRKSQKRETIFSGFATFLQDVATEEERHRYLGTVVPHILQRALMIEELAEEKCIPYSVQQQASTVTISRRLAASILACSFLCLWPDRPGRGGQLCGINFTGFFSPVLADRRETQSGKLRCMLTYFQQLAEDPDGPTGNLSFTRQVLTLDSQHDLEGWLGCDRSLCAMLVCEEGKIEDTGPSTLHVDFANKKLGGGVLGHARVQEEIRFSVCPECIVGMLFSEMLQDNEAITIQGFDTYSQYSGYGSSFRFAGRHTEPAQRDKDGNIDSCMVAIDATSFSRRQKDQQYGGELLLRELNKAYVGFNQPESCWLPTDITLAARLAMQQTPSEGASPLDEYSNKLSGSILLKAILEMKNISDVSDDGRGQHLAAQRTNACEALPKTECEAGQKQASVYNTDCNIAGFASSMVNSALNDVTGRRVSFEIDICRQVELKEETSNNPNTNDTYGASSLTCGNLPHTEEQITGSNSGESKGNIRKPSHETMGELINGEYCVPAITKQMIDLTSTSPKLDQDFCKMVDLATHFVDQVLEEAKDEFIREQTKKHQPGIPQISVELIDSPLVDPPSENIVTFADCLSCDVMDQAVKQCQQILSRCDTEKELGSATGFNGCVHWLNNLIFDSTSGQLTAGQSRRNPVDPEIELYSERLSSQIIGDVWETLEDLANYKPDGGLYEEQLFAFATDFVQDVMDSAILEAEGISYITRVQSYPSIQSQCSTEKSDSDYFMEEFGWSARKPSLSTTDMKMFAEDLARRGSSEDSLQNHRRASCGFKDNTLANLACELISSNPNSPSIEMFETMRRGSRDSLLTRRSSGGSEFGYSSSSLQRKSLASSHSSIHDQRDFNSSIDGARSPNVSLSLSKDDDLQGSASSLNLDCLLPLNNSKRVVSFEDISERGSAADVPPEHAADVLVSIENLNRSHEAILEWFSASRRTSEADVSLASGNSMGAHIEWFVEDLLVEAFRDAFEDLFGESYIDYYCTRYDTQSGSRRSSEEDTEKVTDNGLMHFAENFVKSVLTEAAQIAGTNCAPSVTQSGVKVGPCHIIENLSDNLTNQILQEALQQTSRRSSHSDTKNLPEMKLMPRCVATGNWGCGAFKGDPQLKAMLQWAAASRAGVPAVIYYTFHNEQVAKLGEVCTKIKRAGWTTSDLLHHVVAYGQEYFQGDETRGSKSPEKDLFQYLLEKLEKSSLI